MNRLVFLQTINLNEEPFTTSEVIAEYGKVEHETIVRLITRYQNDLNEFGVIRFEIGFNPITSRNFKSYKLNEEQQLY
ncbi:hypothetical protein NHI66_003189 [Clostridium botulinum]|nr:hypothetical protein [Clostridium botulinum]